jgi:DNA polymerase-3 subunit alpha
MYFDTWIDGNGEHFDSAHFPDNLKQFPFQGGCYLLFGTVEVVHLPIIMISKIAKKPFISDPRYPED